MKLNVKALAFAVALVWAGAIFVTGLVNLIWPGYGEAFLQMVGSVYPGYSGGTSFLQVLLGTALSEEIRRSEFSTSSIQGKVSRR